METTIIDLRQHVEPQRSYGGREVLRNVYFRVKVPDYDSALLYFHDRVLQEKADKAVKAFFKEIIEILKADGWTITDENSKMYCPSADKDNQHLYCHPQEISGRVAPDNIKHMEQLFATAKAFKHYHTDNYQDVIVATSTEDTKQIYHEMYDDKIDGIILKAAATKQRKRYYKRSDIVDFVCSKINLYIVIDNSKSGNSEWGLAGYVHEQIDKLIASGWLQTADNGDLIRTANKTEQRKLKLA